MRVQKQIVIISGELGDVHEVLTRLPRITTNFRIDPMFLSKETYPQKPRNLLNTRFEYFFYIGEPQFGSQQDASNAILIQVPDAKAVILELPIDEEALLEAIRVELATPSQIEGQQFNPNGGKEF